MKFLVESPNEDDDILERVHLVTAMKFKRKIIRELRHLDQRIIEDNGTLMLHANHRITYDGNDFDLACEIKEIIENIKWGNTGAIKDSEIKDIIDGVE